MILYDIYSFHGFIRIRHCDIINFITSSLLGITNYCSFPAFREFINKISLYVRIYPFESFLQYDRMSHNKLIMIPKLF